MSLKELENITEYIVPRCVTCGCTDYFETNEVNSYIKCTNCGREYFGGKDELLEYNQDEIVATKERLQKVIADKLQKELLKAFKKK